MRLGSLAADLFTLKYQTKHFLRCEVSIKQEAEEKHWVSGIKFTRRTEGKFCKDKTQELHMQSHKKEIRLK